VVIDPLVMAGLTFGALLVPVYLAGSAHPRPPRRRRRDGQAGIDHGAMAEIEEHDIEQMIEGLNERRRRNGRQEIGDELADELMRSTWDRERG
jgi:hypothetical protein